MKTRIRTIYIDDDERELERYIKRFEENELSRENFEIITVKAQDLLGRFSEIQGKNPELILVDYFLNKPDEKQRKSPVFGLTLSTELKQNFQEVPIVLFTRKSVFKIEEYSRIDRTISNLLDDIIYKDELFKQNEKLDSLYALARGFKMLRENGSREWEDLLEILNAPQNDEDYLKHSNPPLAPRERWIVSEAAKWTYKWSVSEAANWIRNILIKYPGILYGPVHSATLLGISEDGFLSKSIQDFFSEAKYSGVFAPSKGRWWRSKLRGTAFSIMNEEERDLPIREGFPLAWKRTKNMEIEKSKCVFSGEHFPEWVCYILRKPVMIKYSLAYRADDRPPVMDEARVSYEAIRTTNEINDDLFDHLGREMLEGIRKMKKR
jgi:hypothetical protein